MTSGLGSVAARLPRGLRYRRVPVSAGHLARRVLTGLVAIWGAVTIMFVAVYGTGNPAVMLVKTSVTDAELARITALYGFDRPLPVQYLDFTRQILTGHFPDSIRYGENALTVALERLPMSLLLGGIGIALGLLVGCLLGYLAAIKPGRLVGVLPISVATALEAIPTFLFGVLLIFLFSVVLGWLPTGGAGEPQQLLMPALTLTVYFVPTFARVFRTSVLEALGSDHLRYARSTGLPKVRRVLRHVIGNSLTGVFNVAAIQAGAMIGGAVVTEVVFSWPGIGQLFISSVNGRDYPVVLACAFVMAIGFVVVNLVADTLAAAFDPKARR